MARARGVCDDFCCRNSLVGSWACWLSGRSPFSIYRRAMPTCDVSSRDPTFSRKGMPMMSNYSLNWTAAHASAQVLATSAAASYFSR